MTDENHRIKISWSGDDNFQFLKLGGSTIDVATLRRHSVHWSISCDLPGFRPTKIYGKLEEQRSDTERQVRSILDQFGTVYLPMPTHEAAFCHRLLDEEQIPRLGEDDLTLQLSDRIRLLTSRIPRAPEDNT